MTSRPRPAPEAEGDAPPCEELLADAADELEAGRLPAEFAVEEIVHLLERMPSVARVRRRRRALEVFDQVAREKPGASQLAIAEETWRRTGELVDTVRRWDRQRWAETQVNGPTDRGEARGREET